DTIEIINGAGVARGAQHQVIFDPNIHTAGSIDLLTPDGKRLRSHILALNWYDSQQDKNVQIAETKDCIGEFFPPNRIAFQDAFSNFKIAVVYTQSRGGFEQDVVIREPVPMPETLGLNPETSALEIYTEFLDPPEPAK